MIFTAFFALLWSIAAATTAVAVAVDRSKPYRSQEEFRQAAQQFLEFFDSRFPSPARTHKQTPSSSVSASATSTSLTMNQVYSPIQLQNMHAKRCVSIEIPVAIDDLLVSNRWTGTNIQRQPVLVATPCLGSDSLGNNLGSYFENLMCAKTMGLHFIGASPFWEPSQNDEPSLFLQEMPMVVYHNRSVSSTSEIQGTIRNICRCPGSCHERKYALWTTHLNEIRPLLLAGINRHLKSLVSNNMNYTIVSTSDLSTVSVDKKLPLIPDVAIHYRCGDNFVGHYGFLPFSAFLTTIPANSETIFVLAENRERKTKQKRHLATKCDAIFPGMLQYLKKHFPTSNIVIRRGDDLYTDMARLAMAKVTICSVSTFCLWPAIMNQKGKAYFPQTKLIVGGDTSVNLGFEWIVSPPILLGKMYDQTPPPKFLSILMGEEVREGGDQAMRSRAGFKRRFPN